MINLTVFGKTDIGLKRKNNEDAFVVADLTGGNMIDTPASVRFEVGQRGVLVAVSDGMGGHQAGEVASALVVQSLLRSMASAPTPSPHDTLMEEAVKKASRDVREAAHLPGREHMGATLTAMYICGQTAHIAEVGDSRAYLLRGGSITQVTHDQSFVQVLVDVGSLTEDEAKRSEYRSVILQSMGQPKDVKVALGRLELRDHDCFVLCSDGLSNAVEPDEIRDIVLRERNLDVAACALVALANERGGDDNITVIIGGVSGDLTRPAVGETAADSLSVIQAFKS